MLFNCWSLRIQQQNRLYRLILLFFNFLGGIPYYLLQIVFVESTYVYVSGQLGSVVEQE